MLAATTLLAVSLSAQQSPEPQPQVEEVRAAATPAEDPALSSSESPQRPWSQSIQIERLLAPEGVPGLISAAKLRHRVPRAAKQRYDRAGRFVRRNQRERATEELEAAIREDTEFAEAHRELGVQYAHLGRIGEAETQLKKSTMLGPSDWIALYNLSIVLIQEGKIAEADESAHRSQEVSGDNPRTQMLMALIRFRDPTTRAKGIEELRLLAETVPEAAALLRRLPVSNQK